MAGGPPAPNCRRRVESRLGFSEARELCCCFDARGLDFFRHDFEAGQAGLYYLRVNADYQRVSGLRPSSAPYRFRIRGL